MQVSSLITRLLPRAGNVDTERYKVLIDYSRYLNLAVSRTELRIMYECVDTRKSRAVASAVPSMPSLHVLLLVLYSISVGVDADCKTMIVDYISGCVLSGALNSRYRHVCRFDFFWSFSLRIYLDILDYIREDSKIVMNAAPDVRALIHALCHPTSNEAYIRDQKTLTDLFKEPGQPFSLTRYEYDECDELIRGHRLLHCASEFRGGQES